MQTGYSVVNESWIQDIRPDTGYTSNKKFRIPDSYPVMPDTRFLFGIRHIPTRMYDRKAT